MSDLRISTSKPPEQQPFEDFYADVWPTAFRLATFFTQDPAAGEEIAQEVLTGMYQSWGTADRPEAYLRTALLNASNNWHRRAKVRRNKLPLLAQQDRVESVFPELTDAVGQLPFRQRAVLVLRYHGGYSEAEIAETLGCRPGTVKSLASRALKQLSKEITR